ncbi:MAG: DsbC family protein [Syntrophaceae bacterium]|nr:DsbC family protein [Syntrophaceae bacterium]
MKRKVLLSGLVLFSAVLLVFAVIPRGPIRAFSPTGCEGDCSQCHRLNKEDARGILKSLKMVQAEVVNIQMSPIKGLWEVSLDDRGKKGLLYVDFSHKYVLPGPIIEVKTGSNKTLEKMGQMQEKKRVDFARIPLPSPLVLGSPEASKRIAVFTDPDCPFCGKLHAELEKVVRERKDVSFHILLFPLAMHKDAYWKSKSILCRRSLEMLEEAFDQKPVPRVDCDTQEIEANIRLAQSLGITGTPTLVAPDGRVLSGMVPAEQIVQFIQ